MELHQFDQAKELFTRTLGLFKTQLKAILASSSGDGAAATAATASNDEISIEEMIKPSIFDTDASKRVKSMMVEV